MKCFESGFNFIKIKFIWNRFVFGLTFYLKSIDLNFAFVKLEQMSSMKTYCSTTFYSYCRNLQINQNTSVYFLCNFLECREFRRFSMHAFVLNTEILDDHGILVRVAICLFIVERRISFLERLYINLRNVTQRLDLS